VRGNGIQMHNLASSASKPSYKSGNESIYVCMIPYIADGDSYEATFHTEIPNPMDSTGMFSNNQPQLVALDNADGNKRCVLTNAILRTSTHALSVIMPRPTSIPASINVRF